MVQERLINAVTKKIGKHQSLIDAVAHALDISYDAAHRRISMKSKFSMEEAVLLSQHFDISLDRLAGHGDQVLVNKTRPIKSFADLATYLENAMRALAAYSPGHQTTLFYSAKDIPLFYTIGTGLLAKFKSYVWLNLLDFGHDDMPFEMFQLQAPTQETSGKLNDFYRAVNTREIWNDTTINSSLQQIMYFFQAGLLSASNGRLLCDALKELVFAIEQKCVPGNEQYQLYYHELLILNNNVLVTDAHKKSLFVPYTMLGYFITDDCGTCSDAADFFAHQLKNSKLLNKAGTRDKRVFFNKAYQKIELFRNQLAAEEALG